MCDIDATCTINTDLLIATVIFQGIAVMRVKRRAE